MANTAPGDNIDLVGEVLAKHWRICEPVVWTDLGVIRVTWRYGQQYWLSQSEEKRSAELIRQAQLVQRLRFFWKTSAIRYRFPRLLPVRAAKLS